MSTILLADDEFAMLEVYSIILERLGHRVLRAGDGEQALELARSQRPDLVVTDWMMPRMNGIELRQALSRDEALQGVPVILHSASDAPKTPGFFAFLPKTGELKRFEEAVTRALAGSSHDRGQIPLKGVALAHEAEGKGQGRAA